MRAGARTRDGEELDFRGLYFSIIYANEPLSLASAFREAIPKLATALLIRETRCRRQLSDSARRVAADFRHRATFHCRFHTSRQFPSLHAPRSWSWLVSCVHASREIKEILPRLPRLSTSPRDASHPVQGQSVQVSVRSKLQWLHQAVNQDFRGKKRMQR